jgi:hypothetical protein
MDEGTNWYRYQVGTNTTRKKNWIIKTRTEDGVSNTLSVVSSSKQSSVVQHSRIHHSFPVVGLKAVWTVAIINTATHEQFLLSFAKNRSCKNCSLSSQHRSHTNPKPKSSKSHRHQHQRYFVKNGATTPASSRQFYQLYYNGGFTTGIVTPVFLCGETNPISFPLETPWNVGRCVVPQPWHYRLMASMRERFSGPWCQEVCWSSNDQVFQPNQVQVVSTATEHMGIWAHPNWAFHGWLHSWEFCPRTAFALPPHAAPENQGYAAYYHALSSRISRS